MIPCDFYPASEEYADFIGSYTQPSLGNLYEFAAGGCVNLVSREYAIVHVPLEQAEPLSIARYGYNPIPKLYGLLDTTALEKSGVLPVFDQPSLMATGEGILIGFIDTGIDYMNPLFRRSDGSTRILSIWDQSIRGEDAPPAVGSFQPFYGSVYDREAINEALLSEDPYRLVPSRDADGHGTFMAGVAAGNRTGEPSPFSGAAPDAAIAVVKLKPAKRYLRDFFLISPDAAAYQENDIMTGVAFLLALAGELKMPLVICLGVGTSQGAHDGASPLATQLQLLMGIRGISAVAGAGNEVGFRRHFLGELAENQEFQDVELRVAQGEPGFCLELWAETPELYTVGFISPSGEVVPPVAMLTENEISIPLRLDSTRISLTYKPYEAGSGSQLIFLRFQTPSPGLWHIRVYPSVSVLGRFHMWLPMQGFVSDDTFFLRSNPDTTITDPGNGIMPITVSTYNHRNNSIYIHSSRGYTRSGRQKPELAAPGVEVQGPSLLPPSGDGGVSFSRRSGSSVAAAIMAGAVADIQSWSLKETETVLTSTAVKSLLIRGADRNPDLSYPNRQWGYGTLNLYASFLLIR